MRATLYFDETELCRIHLDSFMFDESIYLAARRKHYFNRRPTYQSIATTVFPWIAQHYYVTYGRNDV